MTPTWAPSILTTSGGESQDVQVFAHFLPEFLAFDRLTELIADPRLSGQALLGHGVSSIFTLLYIAPPILGNLSAGLPTLMRAVISASKMNFYTIYLKESI